MKKRFAALALAVCLALGLTACRSKDPAPTGDPAVTAQPTQTAPAASLAPTGAPESGTPAPSQVPSESVEPEASEVPEESKGPDETNLGAMPGGIVPTPAPSEEAPAKEVTAADMYAAVSKAAGVSYDSSTDYIDSYYTSLNTGDLTDYVFYMPAMSDQLQEIFIAKVSSGKMDAVKAACRDRQAAMAEEAAFYGTTGAYVDSYQLVSEGDWVLFCVCEKAGAAVEAFRSCVK